MLQFTGTLWRSSSFKAGLVCLAACCSLWYFIGHDKPKLLAAIDARIVDSMFRLRGSQETSGAVVIVDMTKKVSKNTGNGPGRGIFLPSSPAGFMRHPPGGRFRYAFCRA